MPRTPGLFITGTDTGVGKTYIGALIARSLSGSGRRVGVYKPAASGCRRDGDRLVSDDAVALWNAAGRPGELDRVCPQRFVAPLAPHLAAREEGRRLDAELLRRGVDYWRGRAEIILVEGAGGLMSPLAEDAFVADLAEEEFAFPLVVVSRNALGTINQTLQTLIAAAAFRTGLAVAGVVLNHPTPPAADDLSLTTNRRELAARSSAPILAEVAWGEDHFEPAVDWFGLAHDCPLSAGGVEVACIIRVFDYNTVCQGGCIIATLHTGMSTPGRCYDAVLAVGSVLRDLPSSTVCKAC